jgi:hypothetical protein
MGDYVYRSYADLEALGKRVVEKAAEITMWQDESYSQAQQDSINDYSKAQAPATPTKNTHYSAPTSGDPSDPQNVKAYVRSALADVPQYFTAFSVPDPDTINEAITSPFYRTAGTLVPNLQLTRKNGGEQLTTETLAGSDSKTASVNELVDFITTIHMKHWTGDAANKFTGYCLTLKKAAQLQHQFAVSLAEVMDAHLEIRRRQLTDVWNIGEKTIKTLDALDSWCSRRKTTQNVLTVVGAIAAVVVVVSTDGAAAPVAAEGVQSLAAILGTLPDSKEEPADISGATVQAVIQSMFDKIQQLHQRIDEQEERLRQALTSLQGAVRGLLPTLLVEPPMGFTELTKADVGALRTTFVDR